jgi:hypothetical protein
MCSDFQHVKEMMCAAKNDEREMFANLVQHATEVKNLPDNFITSSIDEENHSLLHYLVVSLTIRFENTT